ncbi:eukaryotic mitochondrial regulator protein-domain-containing protein [Aspergillus ambiguus]|uniref:mitochondrial 37S ribosomal protein mS45 n=1 Tax=Aspergillus ambiguus TaxID=176160 RepID=UPI003CCD7588
MPPRIQNQLVSNSLLPYLSSTSATLCSSTKVPSPSSTSCSSSRRSSRPFSSTSSTQTKLRADMFSWLNGEGAALKTHLPGQTNYLTQLRYRRAGEDEAPERTGRSRPFPLNPNFVSEPILSEELRNEIYERVVRKKKSVRAVSVELGVDMRRVGAVVRLVELERRMKQQNKELALPYARAVHEMVPTTPLYDDPRDQRSNPHESINDLPVHRLTDPQIFYPVSESRQFTRTDAGRVFSAAPAQEHAQVARDAADPDAAVTRVTQQPGAAIETVGKGADEQRVLQPADVRIPHPHLIAHERHRLAHPFEGRETQKLYERRLRGEEEAERARKQAAKDRAEQRLQKVRPAESRFEFRFKDVEVSRETVGADGRGAQAPGQRYGVPSYERKKGQVKIPTRVEV